MGTWVAKVVLVIFCFDSSVLSIHTSDKLDFGDTPHRSSLVKSDRKLPLKVTRTVDTITSPSENIGVSCGPTGCNTTNNNSSVETEVVVRVKTNVNLDRSQDKKDVEDISDVPIVVGYRGSNLDETPNEEQFRSYSPVTPDPNDVSSRSDYIPLRPLYTDSPLSSGRGFENDGSARSDYAPYRPLYAARPVSIGGEYGRHDLSSEIPYRHGSLNYGSQRNGYSGSVYSTTPLAYGYYGPTSSSRIPNSYYSSSPRTVEINGVASPLSATLPELNRRNYDYNTFRDSGDELHIPHFEHTYNKHYFGEEPPPHTVLYPKSNSFNPVEFRDIPKNKWRPSFFNGRANKYAFNNAESNVINPYTHNHNRPISYSHTHQRGQGDPSCACREQRTDDESNPYGAASANHHIAVQSKNPGATIDDKYLISLICGMRKELF